MCVTGQRKYLATYHMESSSIASLSINKKHSLNKVRKWSQFDYHYDGVVGV